MVSRTGEIGNAYDVVSETQKEENSWKVYTCMEDNVKMVLIYIYVLKDGCVNLEKEEPAAGF